MDFEVNITEEELLSLKAAYSNIRYEKVVDFLLPNFNGEEYFKWIAARILLYMAHLIWTQEYKPQYYDPEMEKVVLGTHVA